MFGLPTEVSSRIDPGVMVLNPPGHTVLANGAPLLIVAPGIDWSYVPASGALLLELLRSRPDVAAALIALTVLSAQKRAHG